MMAMSNCVLTTDKSMSSKDSDTVYSTQYSPNIFHVQCPIRALAEKACSIKHLLRNRDLYCA